MRYMRSRYVDRPKPSCLPNLVLKGELVISLETTNHVIKELETVRHVWTTFHDFPGRKLSLEERSTLRAAAAHLLKGAIIVGNPILLKRILPLMIEVQTAQQHHVPVGTAAVAFTQSEREKWHAIEPSE